MVKALVMGAGGATFEERPRPTLRESTDVVVQVGLSAVGKTDLLFAGDRSCRPETGTVLGHQAVGTVVEAGSEVATVHVGDRVVVSATVACGGCAYCKVGFYAQCVRLNPRGAGVGGVYLGGPGAQPPIDGVHAELVRVPFADVGLVAVPDWLTDGQALLLSEAMPVGYFGAKLARICAGDRVAVFGADPSGLVAAVTSLMLGAGRVIVVDDSATRLDNAARLGPAVETVQATEAGAAVRRLTDDRGVQCAIVPQGAGLDHTVKHAGADASARLVTGAVQALSRDSTLALVGVYPRGYDRYPLGEAVSKYVTIKAAACNHSKYLRPLVNMLGSGLLTGTLLAESMVVAALSSPDRAHQDAATSELEWVHVAW